MHELLTRQFRKWAAVKTVLPMLVLTIAMMIVVNTVNLPVTVPRIQEVSQGAGILDMHIYYTAHEANALLGQLGPEGRRVYTGLLLSFDFIFPALYAVTFSLAVALLFRTGFPAWPFLRFLYGVPLAAGLFDWSENVSILAMLLKYPDFSGASHAAGWFTLGKWIWIGLSLAAVLAGGIFRLTLFARSGSSAIDS